MIVKTVKTFHDIYHSKYGMEFDKMASVELQRYLNNNIIGDYQVSYSVERDECGRVCTHILLVHE